MVDTGDRRPRSGGSARSSVGVSRRRFVAAVSASAVLGGTAGCLSGGGPGMSGEDPFEDPPPELAEPVQGESGVRVLVYTDFACSYCRRFATETRPELQDLVDDGRMQYVHRDFPVPVDDWWSWHLPNLPRSAQHQRDERAFWDLYEYIWNNWNEGDFSEEWVRTAAREFDLDPDLTWQAVGFDRYGEYIRQNKAQGEAQGVPGAPSVVIDGERLADYTADNIRSTIEEIESGGTVAVRPR